MNTIHFEGSDFIIDKSELASELLSDLLDCGAPGQDAEPACKYVLETYEITGNTDNCRDYLKRYGAWDETELSDHDENLLRLVWLAGCGLQEEGIVYFSSY